MRSKNGVLGCLGSLKVVSVLIVALLLFQSCEKPSEQIVLRQVRDVMADATSEPLLKAEAVFYNPNTQHGKLKYIDIDIYVNGKKAGTVKKDYRIRIPPQGEFSVPIEVKLNLQEFGLLDTILGMVGGKKFEVQYLGKLRLSYHGIPVKVPVDYKSTIRLRF
ncbi:MAG: LEA type 2 family protein [Bacteroidota bacterium]